MTQQVEFNEKNKLLKQYLMRMSKYFWLISVA